MSVEQELVKATKFKGEKFSDRQEYLTNLLMAIDARISDANYDKLTEEAVDWHQKAATALNKKQDIPDFDDAEEPPPEEPEIEDDGGELLLTNPKHPLHRREPEPEEVEDEPSHTEADDETGEVTDGPAESHEEEEVPRARTKATPKGKKTTTAKGKGEEVGGRKKPVETPDYTALTGEKDRYGIIKGTKTSEVLKMYEKGCTQRQILDRFGSRYYNILKKLATEGHKVEKLENGLWKITHKEDLSKKKGK